MRVAAASLLLLAAGGLWSCGGSDCDSSSGTNAFTGTLSITSASSGFTTCQHTQTVTFTAAGVSAQAVAVAGGDCVTFVNADAASHWPESDPHPAHTQCPELNVAAPLAPGQSHTTAVLSGPKTCGWHDHLNAPASRCTSGGGY